MFSDLVSRRRGTKKVAEVGEAIVPHRWAENAKMDDRPRVVKLLELELGKWDECISFIYYKSA